MKVLKPIYYDKFECSADKCIESCCVGWKVAIDKTTYNRYKKVKSNFSKELVKGISRNRTGKDIYNYGKMRLTDNKRCIFLNKQNLCNVYINLGEDYLCNTCKIYPRSIKKYRNIIERNLTLSCPEVARMISEIEEKLSFVMEEEKLSSLDLYNINNGYENTYIYDLFWQIRSFFIEIAQFREIELWKRLSFLKLCAQKIQKLISDGKYNEIDNVINNLTCSITDESVIKSLDNINNSNEVKNLFIDSIIKMRLKDNLTNTKLLEILVQLDKIIEDNRGNELEVLEKIESEFDISFKDREYILENFIVYTLYKNCMGELESKDINKLITMTILEYALLKKLFEVKWYSNGGNLTNEDVIEIMYTFSRTIEHSNFMKKLCNNVKDAGYDSLAYLTILIR